MGLNVGRDRTEELKLMKNELSSFLTSQINQKTERIREESKEKLEGGKKLQD